MTLALQKQIAAARLKSEDYIRLYRAVGVRKAPLLAGAMDRHFRNVLADAGFSPLDLEKVVAELHRRFAAEWCALYLDVPGLLTPDMKPWIEGRLANAFFVRSVFLGVKRHRTELLDEIVEAAT
jgi:hypothetical protein